MKMLAGVPLVPITDEVRQIGEAFQRLSGNPRGPNCQKLTARGNEYRMRCGDYRILYTIVDKLVMIFVIAVRHRKDAYR